MDPASTRAMRPAGRKTDMDASSIDFYTRLAHGIATQFGENCEVVVHDLETGDPDRSIVAIENGHVTGRSVGDGPSHVVLEALHAGTAHHLDDRLAYLTKTPDGRLLKSSTMFIRNERGEAVGIFAINYDITVLTAASSALDALTGTVPADADKAPAAEPEPIVRNVADLLDDLIEQSVALIGKPAALMSKDERVRAIRYLNDTGAFLITKSGPKVCKYFGISKYTLYSYLDEAKGSEAEAGGE